MPEMKRNFAKGKMNKDLDERLVPPGEYRDAMNIQVSTSDEGNVGTIQNILGNTDGCNWKIPNPIEDGSSVIGSISDEKNDSLYWLIAGPKSTVQENLPLEQGATVSWKDMIMRKTWDKHTNGDYCQPVFVDKYAFLVENTDTAAANVWANTISLGDSSINSNIIPGMMVSGYSTDPFQLEYQSQVTHVGALTTIPVTFESGQIVSYTTYPEVTLSQTFGLRTFDSDTNPGVYDIVNLTPNKL